MGQRSEEAGGGAWRGGRGCRLQGEADLGCPTNHAGLRVGTRGHRAICAKDPQAHGEVEEVQVGGRETGCGDGWEVAPQEGRVDTPSGCPGAPAASQPLHQPLACHF